MCVLLHVCELLCLFRVCGFVVVMGCESESGMIVRREIWNEKESATAIDGYSPQCNKDDMTTR